MQGWIKLHRILQDWEWKNSPKHVAVFIDILLNVNHKEKNYRGLLIPAGSMTTSYDAMSKRTGVSIRGLRTVLKDLKTTNEVTQETTSKYSMISVVNWDKYQSCDTPDDKQATSKRQASDKQATTNKNVKNVKNVNNEKNDNNKSSAKPERASFKSDIEEIYTAHYPKKLGKKKGIAFLVKQIKTPQQVEDFRQAVINYKNLCQDQDKKFIKHFSTFAREWEDFANTEDIKGELPVDDGWDREPITPEEFEGSGLCKMLNEMKARQ